MNKFPKRLKELREEKGLSQLSLGKDLGITQAGIAKWEAGTRSPNIENIILLAKYFAVTSDFLLGLED